MKKLRSPIIRVGGKGTMISELLPLFPPHHIYVEPFAGGASLLFAKEPSPVEILNDVDRTLISFFRMLRNENKFKQFQIAINLTPYSREEYNDCLATWRDCSDEIEKLRKWFVINRQCFGGKYAGGWGYAIEESIRGISGRVSRWLSIINLLPDIVARLKTVQIDCQDFRKCIQIYDTKNTFFYCDPPYVLETRSNKEYYKYEFNDQSHQDLIDILLNLKGRVMISGYSHPIYTPLEQAGWTKVDFDRPSGVPLVKLGGKRRRKIETIWMNYE